MTEEHMTEEHPQNLEKSLNELHILTNKVDFGKVDRNLLMKYLEEIIIKSYNRGYDDGWLESSQDYEERLSIYLDDEW